MLTKHSENPSERGPHSMPANTSSATPLTDPTRLFAESSRRTVDNSKVVVEAARGLLDEATEVNAKYVQAWVAGVEGALKASFELQNASFTAISAFSDA